MCIMPFSYVDLFILIYPVFTSRADCIALFLLVSKAHLIQQKGVVKGQVLVVFVAIASRKMTSCHVHFDTNWT